MTTTDLQTAKAPAAEDVAVTAAASSPSSAAETKSDLDHWVEVVKQCKYLPENDLKVSGNELGGSVPGLG